MSRPSQRTCAKFDDLKKLREELLRMIVKNNEARTRRISVPRSRTSCPKSWTTKIRQRPHVPLAQPVPRHRRRRYPSPESSAAVRWLSEPPTCDPCLNVDSRSRAGTALDWPGGPLRARRGRQLASASRRRPQRRPRRSGPHPGRRAGHRAGGRGHLFGSGTLVDVHGDYGLVLTNWHVVADATARSRFVFPDGFRSAARLITTDRTWDLAALASGSRT